MVKDFRLELNHPSGQAVYTTPGEVTRNVVVVTDEPKSYNAITIRLKGYAFVSWHQYKHTYYSRENYFNQVIVLWNNEQIPNRVLDPGQYVLPFQFLISGKFPSSFAGIYGYIRYEVEARISTGQFHVDKKVSAHIQVVDRVNINVPALLRKDQFGTRMRKPSAVCAAPLPAYPSPLTSREQDFA